MTTQQIIRIVIIAMVFVVPVIIRMVKAAGEAKERRRLEQLRQYQIDEAMRTGRPVVEVMAQPMPQAQAQVNPQQVAQQRLREMAARRQAQIEALRRQRAQGAAPAPVTPPASGYSPQGGRPTPTMYQQGPARTTGYQPQAGHAPKPAARAPRRTQQAQRQVPGLAPPPQDFPPPTGEIGGTAHDHDGDVTHRLVPDAPEGPETAPRQTKRPTGVSGGSVTVGLKDLRQAIVLREVLGRPVAMREPGEGA